MSASSWKRTSAVAGRFILALAIVALVPASAAVAQAGKVAVIDVQRLVTDSVAGKEALARLKKLQDEKIAEGKAKNDEVDGLRKRLNEGRLSLADDKISELEKQLEEKVTGLRRFQEDAERDFNKSRRDDFRRDRASGLPGHRAIWKRGQLHLYFQQVPERPAVRGRRCRHHQSDHPALRHRDGAEG